MELLWWGNLREANKLMRSRDFPPPAIADVRYIN